MSDEQELSNSEIIICQSSREWAVNFMGDMQRLPLILTNKKLIVGDKRNTFNLTDLEKCEFIPMDKIEITFPDRIDRLIFSKQSIGRAVDQFASLIMGEPFEAGSWQEEVSSYTAYWASLITMAIALYGHPVKLGELEEAPSHRRAYCRRCEKYFELPWSEENVWTLVCPECGNKGMTTYSPKDRL